MNRRQWLTGATAAIAPAAPARRPNILFIMADEYRGDALGCAGHPVVKTPNLDRLASSGVRFTRHSTSSPLCTPARHSVFNGRYAHVHGVLQNGRRARAGEVLLPRLLARHGYETALSGKLHFTAEDSAGLFDIAQRTEQGPFAGGHRAYIKRVLPKIGDPEVEMIPGTGRADPIPYGTSPIPEEHTETAWIADRAIDYIRSRKGSSRPWFCFCSFIKPHSEFVIPEPYASMYRPADMPLPDLNVPRPKAPDNKGRMSISDPELLRQITAKYFGAVTMVDRHAGRVLDAVEANGFDENTIVVFTGDHGNLLGEHGRLFKLLMYEGSIHVPLILRWPGGPRGKTESAVSDNTALPPTLLSLAGLPAPSGMQGELLVSRTPRNAAFAVLGQRMIRTTRWKLIDPFQFSASGAGWELYDLREDPREMRNLYGAPVAAAVQKELRERLEEWWSRKPVPVTL